MIERDPNTIYLSKPKEAHGETITSITLRPPEGEDIMAAGYPMRIINGDNGNTGVEPLSGPIAKYISRLGNVPPHIVKSLNADEWNQGMGVVLGFFGEEAEKGKTEKKPPSNT